VFHVFSLVVGLYIWLYKHSCIKNLTLLIKFNTDNQAGCFANEAKQ